MPRNILVLNLHPAPRSLCGGLASAYAEGAASAGHEVRQIDLAGMTFDPDFGQAGFKSAKPLEPDLEAMMQSTLWADHLLLVSPMWWGGLPGKAKSMFDRAYLPGRAFDPRIKKMGLPKPLLAGRSARFVMTSDTPGWAFRLMYGSALKRQVKNQILGYVGIKPMAFTQFAPVEHSTPEIRARWIATMRNLGQAGR